MIKILYGTGVIANNDGTPVNPPSYWSDEIQAGIQATFELGEGVGWEPIPDSEPPPPDPDWTTFNLTLIPPAPGSQTTFETWLDQFKIQHQAPLASAAGLGNLGETQRLYDSFKAISQDESTPQTPPTPEQIAEWQAVADACHIPIRF